MAKIDQILIKMIIFDLGKVIFSEKKKNYTLWGFMPQNWAKKPHYV